jgi:hypothetical protein
MEVRHDVRKDGVFLLEMWSRSLTRLSFLAVLLGASAPFLVLAHTCHSRLSLIVFHWFSPFPVSFGSSPIPDLCIAFIPRSLALALCSIHSVVTPDQAPLASRYGSRSQLLGSSLADKRIWCFSESVYMRPVTESDQHRLFLLFLFCSLCI